MILLAPITHLFLPNAGLRAMYVSTVYYPIFSKDFSIHSFERMGGNLLLQENITGATFNCISALKQII